MSTGIDCRISNAIMMLGRTHGMDGAALVETESSIHHRIIGWFNTVTVQVLFV